MVSSHFLLRLSYSVSFLRQISGVSLCHLTNLAYVGEGDHPNIHRKTVKRNQRWSNDESSRVFWRNHLSYVNVSISFAEIKCEQYNWSVCSWNKLSLYWSFGCFAWKILILWIGRLRHSGGVIFLKAPPWHSQFAGYHLCLFVVGSVKGSIDFITFPIVHVLPSWIWLGCCSCTLAPMYLLLGVWFVALSSMLIVAL